MDIVQEYVLNWIGVIQFIAFFHTLWSELVVYFQILLCTV